METFGSGDLNGDFENGASKNAHVNGKNKYLNDTEPVSADSHVINWPSCDA